MLLHFTCTFSPGRSHSMALLTAIAASAKPVAMIRVIFIMQGCLKPRQTTTGKRSVLEGPKGQFFTCPLGQEASTNRPVVTS